MDYDQIVFLGYVLDTAPAEGPDGEEYLGLADPALDIEARCELLAGAMAKARTMVDPPAEDTLYVFVAPEFLMRGKTGAYTMDDLQLAIVGLQELAADAQWDNWVFVFGTIIGQWVLEDPDAPIQIVNFAPVQEGGAAAQGPDGASIIVKELMSGIDFIAEDANPGGLLLGAVDHPPPSPPSPGGETQQVAYDGAGIFPMRDMTWAVEICLDHLEHRIQNSPQLPGESLVQVQIVPSCGADIDDANIIAQAGGYVFNVDGLRGTSHARLVQVANPPVPVQRTAVEDVDIDEVTLDSVSPPLVVNVTRDLYARGSGEIWLYKPVAVPPAETVPGATDKYAWPACDSPRWSFTFYLIYDEQEDGQGNTKTMFQKALCVIHSTAKDFKANKYELALIMDLYFEQKDSEPKPGWIEISMQPGGDGYDNAIYAEIRVPGFSFQGEIMQFMNDRNSAKKLQKIW
jgi:hypothetical protein